MERSQGDPVIIGLDIDGTVFEHSYPALGKDVGAFPWLLKAQKLGARFIVFTMRDGAELKAAVEALREGGIDIYGANVNPTQWEWTMSPKPYCHLYIDDTGLGVPLLAKVKNGRGTVDWDRAGPMMLEVIDAWSRAHGVKQSILGERRYTGGE